MDEIFLLRGNDFKVNDFITVKHPTLEEIMQISESKYYQLIYPFILSSENWMVEYDDIGIDYTTVDNYQTCLNILQSIINSGEDFCWLLNFSFNKDNIEIFEGINKDIIIISKLEDSKGKIIFDRLTYQRISDFLCKINNVSVKNKYNPGNQFTKQRLIREERKKKEKRKLKDEESELGKIISALVWRNTSGINFFNVWQLHIYQTFNGLTTLCKIEKVQNLLHGIYSGIISAKDVNSDDLSWLN